MEEPKINVSILTSDEINFDLNGEFFVNGITEKQNGRYSAKIVNGKISVEKDDRTLVFENEVIFLPNDMTEDSFLIRDVIIGIKFHWEKKEKERFVGSLKLLKDNDKIIAINIVPLEDYLTSVISSEMSATSSKELLKAHSIISRSWLLAQIEKGKELAKQDVKYNSTYITEDEIVKWYDREDHVLFDVCADDHCQRYQGITKAYTPKVKQAVEETRGLVVSYEGKICDARFSKTCGGISESFENVWEPVKHAYLTSVIDYKFEPDNYELDLTKEEAADVWIRNSPSSFCNTNDPKVLAQVLLDYDQTTTDFYRWKVEFTNEDLSKLILEKSGIDYGEIIDMVPLERGHSGRLIKLKIIGTKKTFIIGKELEIRRTLSKSHLYSSAFVVDKFDIVNGIPQKFVLTGAGWGHGVGLCQIGAAVMGEKGYRFDEILLHYFKNSTILKIY
ncbi:MAG: SpoIID/LytB domain-containing protein [bacterium]